MKLSLEGIRQNQDAYLKAGYSLPTFDYEKVRQNTLQNPLWIHFGPGNLFRAYQAHVVQKLLNAGKMHTGLIAAEGYDYEIIEKSSLPYDNLTILATLNPDNSVEKTVIASIMESLLLDSENEAQFLRLKEIFANPSLQLASFTITEKGYATTSPDGEILPAIAADFAAGPLRPACYLGKVAALLHHRFLSGGFPLAMVSMDNCSHNGDLLKSAMLSFAEHWSQAGLADQSFTDYIRDSSRVSFPLTMIDKITPRPDPRVEALLSEDGVEDLSPVTTAKNSYAAPFVNAEKCEYLVIEDVFPNGRPPLEHAGILFTDRETVDKVEKMKVCTCLNPLHTALAIFGCLLGYTSIAEEMQDPALKKLVEGLGYKEGLPVVVHPGIMEPKAYLDTVLRERFPNPFLPDSPQRIATDTSQKLPVRFGETIKAYQRQKDLQVSSLTLIPLVFAGWLRYLMGIDDAGNTFAPSPGPALQTVSPLVTDYSLNSSAKDLSRLDELLSNEKIFGVNLETAGLAEKVKQYFAELTDRPGAVRATLEKYTA